MRGRSCEEEEIGIRRCRIKIRVDIINEEVKGWTSSSKQQQYPPELTKTKEEIRLEQMKRKVKRASLEWYDFVLQEQLKSLIYVDPPLRGEEKKWQVEWWIKIQNFHAFKKIQQASYFLVLRKKKKVYYSSRIF